MATTGAHLGYTIEMRYFLPMVRPSSEEYDGHTDYDTSLDLSKMPAGLSVGEYAFSITRNMQTKRSCTQYGNKSDMLPHLKWSVLIEHVQAYGLANGWSDDGAERAVEVMLEKGAALHDFWDADLVEWPFPGDRCLLAWADAVVNTQMLRKTKTETQRKTKTETQREQPETDGDTCTQLGRWFAQRPELLDQAPEAAARLVHYVQTIDSMSDHAFEFFSSKHGSSHVMHSDGIRGRLNNKPVLHRELQRTFPKPKHTDWVEQAFRSFALGFAWELRAQGNATVFEKVERVLNSAHQWMSPAQLALCMEDERWVAGVMDNAALQSKPSIVELARKNSNHGFEAFYPMKMSWGTKRTQAVVLAKLASANPEWALGMYRLILASSLREHFGNSYEHVNESFEQVQESKPMLEALLPQVRDALFEEFVLSVTTIAKNKIEYYRHNPNYEDYKTKDPWGQYADSFFNAWALHQEDEAVEASTTLGVFMEWLNTWQHPYEADLHMLGVIAGDITSVGNWLSETVARNIEARTGVLNAQNDPQIVLHDLFDFPMEGEAQTDPQNNSQNAPKTGTENVAAAAPPQPVQAQKEQIPPKQDFAVTHPDDYWNVGGLF